MVTWNPAVVFVHLAIPVLPIVKSPFRYAYPAEDLLGCDLGPILPITNIIDDPVAGVVGNPNSV